MLLVPSVCEGGKTVTAGKNYVITTKGGKACNQCVAGITSNAVVQRVEKHVT